MVSASGEATATAKPILRRGAEVSTGIKALKAALLICFMYFVSLNVLAVDRQQVLAVLDQIKNELAKTPDLEFFAMTQIEHSPQFEVVSEKTEALNIWETRQ